MKISVSLSEEDVRFIDEYARRRDRSRSAAMHEAIVSLRDHGLAGAYAEAWAEWDSSDEHELWESTTGDGL
jgi:Arc/MetJ-type ribon-helix-helix transcriptional regulator